MSKYDVFWILYCGWACIGLLYMPGSSEFNPFEYENKTPEIQFIIRAFMFVGILFVGLTIAPIIGLCRYVVWNLDGRK